MCPIRPKQLLDEVSLAHFDWAFLFMHERLAMAF